MLGYPRDDTSALFVPDGSHLAPTVLAVGPWRPDALHGAAVAALFAAALGREDMTVARLTMDLGTAVRLRPLRLEIEDLGGGRRVQRRSAVLHDGERPVARATALYVAGLADRNPDDGRSLPPVTPPPQQLALLPESRAGWPGFENRAMALHTQRGDDVAFEGWFRLLAPAIAGQPMTGLQLAAASADYSSGGTAVMLSLKKWSFMSLDLTVNLTREAAGDWVGLRAGKSTMGALGDGGIAVAASVLHDERGAFGHCTQTQLVQRIG
jgi:Acyl-CoA thioesterase N-terminal domain